ncbi:hypothetical protein ACPCG0_03935 [Propionibacteriaceae bacterium Y1923]|uniref:hypothetical protein n=1 Tax=Aestuariimicrobium sp. Y1814 TaxID=3418742 RepID=UPI003C1EC6C4
MGRRRKLFFELPYSLEAPRLTNPSVGIDRLTERSDATFEMVITLLDAPDQRLLRAGVMLAHRVVDGLGDWYLDAPTWQPWLPTDHSEPLGAAGDLPDDLAELVRPFRRRATLGPVAAVTIERHSYSLKDPEDVSLGSIRDERITIRRGGLTTARFREVTLVPSPAMTGPQRRFLVESLTLVGGIQVDAFPDLVSSLGAPATGLTDYPEPREWDSKVSLETFVSQVFATRLQDIMRADLALRASELAQRVKDAESDEDASAEPAQGMGIEPLVNELSGLRHQISSLASVLEPSWRAGMENDLAAVIAQGSDRHLSALDERYYAVLDGLIAATRAPQLGDLSNRQAAPVLRQQLEAGTRILLDRCSKLRADSPDDAWEAALVATRELLGTVQGLGILFGKLARKFSKQLRKIQGLLEPAQPVPTWPAEQDLAEWTTAQAFEAGRALQRAGDTRDAARGRFEEEWPGLRRKIISLRAMV